jgi:hypothetical protein
MKETKTCPPCPLHPEAHCSCSCPTDYRPNLARKQMTVKEWERLAELAFEQADRCSSDEVRNEYRSLGNKAAHRAVKLAQGIVVP